MFETSLNWKRGDGYNSFSIEEKKVLLNGLEKIEKTFPALTPEQHNQILDDAILNYLGQVQDVLDREEAGFDVENPVSTDFDKYADYSKYKKTGDLYTKQPNENSANVEYEGKEID